MNHDMNVQNMMWRPPLVRLTGIAIPPLGEHPCFVEPDRIVYVRRVAFKDNGMEVTEIHLGGSLAMYVVEPPETVAMLRDRALGHERRPRPA